MGNFSGLGPCGNPAKFARAMLNFQGCTIHPWRLTACSHTSRGFSYDGIFLSKIMDDGNCRCFPPFLIIQGVSTSGWWFQLKNMKSKLDQIGSLPQFSEWKFQKPLSCRPNINTSHQFLSFPTPSTRSRCIFCAFAASIPPQPQTCKSKWHRYGIPWRIHGNGRFTSYENHKCKWNVGKYAIHGWYGYTYHRV